MNILITGAAGFIGFHMSFSIKEKNNIIGIDNINSYYDVKLKKVRLKFMNQRVLLSLKVIFKILNLFQN